ncbi:MAG: hypothetical protein HQL39_12395, partial [Alphaproteobacteria bacterium]|nr:hypothetical protein [Alphaproteobacteria bacterium]
MWQDGYAGARPAFACFRSEVARDIRADDWPLRLRARLGLGHISLKVGQRAYFALMEYDVAEVRAQTPHIGSPFAIPTVLESRNNPHFFPAPQGRGEGYTVDLDHAAGRTSDLRVPPCAHIL